MANLSNDDIIFDDMDFGEIDRIESAFALNGALPPKTAVNRPGLQQRDLFGGVIAEKPVAGPSRGAGAGANAGEPVAKVKQIKRWDPASFAKFGWSKRVAAAKKKLANGGTKGKGKGKANVFEDGWDEEEVYDDEEGAADGDDDDEGQPFYVDPNYDPNAPLLPIKWPPDPEASKTWVYPSSTDKPLRTYQYNICHIALFENTLVSLPTGLGKTFIAAVVMLNFYRWFPKGKILFLAPSRPLVAQQVIACHYIAGIPQADCVELTGSTAPKLRAIGWGTKRIIYSTPQTVENDLAKGRLDPRDVTCLVIDEAHRASGDYAYCGVVRYMMSRNQHFRILALTATPGSDQEAVQEVIDNLHIGNIQVRTDKSMDIKQYIHGKTYDLRKLPLGDDLSSIRDRWGKLMKSRLDQAISAQLLRPCKPDYLAPFAVNQAMSKISSLPGNKQANGRFYVILKTLGKMARAMEHLIVQSLSEFDSQLKDLEADNKKLSEDPEFRRVVRDTRELRAREGYVGHPKMEVLRSMCYDHFLAAENDVDAVTGQKRQTRVMVFCNYRAIVEELVVCLNTKRPLIKATPFVGQASSKGSRGMSQKEQIETIKKFKAGTFNVLVASSIGEEGLDIGEIDLIVCYEANSSPIRMLQRVGRTGRARDGHIIVLMSEGREDQNWQKAVDKYNHVQNALADSRKAFELYVDGDRMLPPSIKPLVDKVEIQAKPINLATMTMAGETALERKISAQEKKKAKKPKDPKRNMPGDAFEGFRSAGQLAAEKSKTMREPSPSPGQILRDRKSAVYLTEDEQEEMRERWFYVNGVPVKATTFDPYSLPFDRGRTGSALTLPRHGTRHTDLLTFMRVSEYLDDSRPSNYDDWLEKMSCAFRKDRTDILDVRRNDQFGTAQPHARLRRPPPMLEEPLPTISASAQTPVDPMSSFPPQAPAATCTVPQAIRARGDSLPRSSMARPSSPLPSPPGVRAYPGQMRAEPSPLIADEAEDEDPSRLSPPPPQQAPQPRALTRTKSAPSKTNKMSPVHAQTTRPTASAPVRARPEPPSCTIYHEEQIGAEPRESLDPFNVLSSSDSESPPPQSAARRNAVSKSPSPHIITVPPRLKPAVPTSTSVSKPPQPSKASTTYSNDFEINDSFFRDISDSQMLNGAVVKGRAESPRAHAQAAATDHPPREAPRQAVSVGPDAIVVVDSSDEEEVVSNLQPLYHAQAPQKLPKGPNSAKLSPFRPAPDRPSSPTVISDSDEAFEPLGVPRRFVSGNLPAVSKPSAPAPRPAPVKAPAVSTTKDAERKAQDDSDDEYGSFDISDDLLDAAFDVALQTAGPALRVPSHATVQGQAREVDDKQLNHIAREPAALDDDIILMPPPPTGSISRPRPRPPTARAMIGRIPDSDSSDVPPQSAVKGLTPHVSSSIDDSPVVVPGWRAAAKRSHVDGPSSKRKRKENEAQSRVQEMAPSDSPVVTAPKLNRMRRGRHTIESDEDEPRDYEAPLNDMPPPPKKVKRPKMTEKEVARNKLFDFEAVNSEASGTEASSEAYNSEDSDDRRFVASEDGDPLDVSPGQARFYRESLLSQAPGFATRPGQFGGGRGLFRRRSIQDGSAHRATPVTPATPNSQDQWSYDSFCVPDDAEIEMEDSSSHW